MRFFLSVFLFFGVNGVFDFDWKRYMIVLLIEKDKDLNLFMFWIDG